MKALTFYVVANAALGPGLSGGDRIFIEWTRRLARKGHRVLIHVWEEGYEMCKRNRLEGVDFIIQRGDSFKKFGLAVLYAVMTLKAILEALRMHARGDSERLIIYSASDFWPDSLPAWLIRRRLKGTKWIAGFYLFAHSPFKGTGYGGRRFLKDLVYYLSQRPIYWLVRKHADMVFVTNELDRWEFIDGKRLTPERVVAVRGGVDTKVLRLVPEPEEKPFDAVFVGRFHPQKGVLELIEIWKLVCENKPGAKLAMIGIGELEEEVREKIRRYGLENNIILFGFKDGVEKIKTLKDSRVVLHPAIYDSGGMAPCEAMACGLPGVSFDLPALRTYYPKGMLKTPCYDLRAFADNVIRLLEDEELRGRLREEALRLAMEWDWNKRAEELLEATKGLF